MYIETSIVSYLTARPGRDLIATANQELTREWWAGPRLRYDLYTSQFVLDEAADGDPEAARSRLAALAGIPLLRATDETRALADLMMERRLLPPRASTDAVHLVMATLHKMDILLTWNCSHLANADILVPVCRFLRASGHEPPVVCTPNGLMGTDEREE